MKEIELEIKEFSTKKLREIIEGQSGAYSESFIDYTKNELIRRGESFPYNVEMQKRIKELNDDDLKSVVERERKDYYLEYMELAIAEYLARGFKNETSYDESIEESEIVAEKRYPFLRAFSHIYALIGVVSFCDILFVLFGKWPEWWPTWATFFLISICIIAGTTYFALAEAIKVFLDIEENTRKRDF